jgi:GTP-binding protein
MKCTLRPATSSRSPESPTSGVSDTICAIRTVEALPPLTVDEPTISMTFEVNTSPFAGGRQVPDQPADRERLFQEASHNVALQVEDTEDPDSSRFPVAASCTCPMSDRDHAPRRLRGGRVAAAGGRKHVVDGERQRAVGAGDVLDLDEQYQGAVMQAMGERKASSRT